MVRWLKCKHTFAWQMEAAPWLLDKPSISIWLQLWPHLPILHIFGSHRDFTFVNKTDVFFKKGKQIGDCWRCDKDREMLVCHMVPQVLLNWFLFQFCWCWIAGYVCEAVGEGDRERVGKVSHMAPQVLLNLLLLSLKPGVFHLRSEKKQNREGGLQQDIAVTVSLQLHLYLLPCTSMLCCVPKTERRGSGRADWFQTHP